MYLLHYHYEQINLFIYLSLIARVIFLLFLMPSESYMECREY